MGTKRYLGTLVLALCGACTPPPPDGAELLREMQLALLESDAYRYRFESSRLSGDAIGAVELSGAVSLLRHGLSGGDFSARVEASPAAGEQGRYTEGFSAVKTQDDVYLADPSERKMRQASMYSAGSKLVAAMEPALLYVLFDPNSLDEEIEATVSWEGTTEIGGEACDLVRVVYNDDPEDSRWCIAGADKLPRRLEWIEEGEGTRLDLTALQTPVQLPEDAFSFETPEGFTVETLQAGPQQGTPVPDFSLALANGETLSIEALRGSVLVFDFWATWCAPCKTSLLSLQETASHFAGESVRFFAVNALENLAPGDPLAFAEQNAITTEIVLDGDEVHEFFAAGNLPALAVVDASGRTQGVSIGFYGEGSEQFARQLIGAALDDSTP